MVADICNVTLYSYTLTGGICSSDDQTVFTCPLTFEDLNEIKRQPFCSFDNSGEDCCLTISGDPINDKANNPLDNIFDGCGFNSTAYIPDTNPPSLVEFTQFNLKAHTVTLTFNETMMASSIDLTKVTFQSFYRNAQMSHTLTGGIVTSSDDITIHFTLFEYDLLVIQRNRGLCSDINNCWISLARGFARDMAENYALEIPTDQAIDTQEFVDDISSPSLVGFELDMNNNTLTLTFDEIVSASPLDASAISFLSEPSVNATVVQLTGGSTTSSDGRVIVIDLLYADTNRIRATEDIGTSEGNTYISITSNLINDAVHRQPNPVIAIPADEAIPITEGGLTADKTPPNLNSFSLNLDFDLISLTFDEPVRVSSIEYYGITLISSQSSTPTDQRTLIGGSNTIDTNINGTMILTGHLVGPDIRYLKLSPLLATSFHDTWLSIVSGAIRDMAGNELVVIPFDMALPTSGFVPDTTPAEFVAYTLDMDLGLLHLTFNDIINASTFYPEALILQNAADISDDFVMLTEGSLTESEDGYFISINISTPDLNRIKFNDDLATHRENVYVSLRAEGFQDNYGENIIATIVHDALPAYDFTNDTTSPVLLNFELDLNNGAIILTFDETVRAETVVEEEIILQSVSNISTNASSVKLTGGISSSIDSTIITVYSVTEDLNEVKRLVELGTDVYNTFISISSDFIMDMNENQVLHVTEELAIMALNIYPDVSSPTILTFTIDLTLEELVLTFNETVNASSLMISEFTIQGTEQQGEEYRQLSDSTHSMEYSTVVTIYLGLNDANEIKRLISVTTSTNDTYLAATEYAIEDMSGNHLSPIPPSAALRALNFSEDVIQPELIGFSLNLSSEILTLSFSETVRATTLTASSITIYSRTQTNITAVSYTLTGGLLSPFNSHIIELELTTSDLNVIKQLTDLAILQNDTFLSILGGAIEDMNGNLLLPTDITTNLVANEVIPDGIPPELLSFNLDINTGILTLMFSETVNVSTFDITQITLQGSSSVDNVTHNHTLSLDSSTTSHNSAIVIVDISDTDLNEIKRLHFLARDNSSTYLSTTDTLVEDMSMNSLIPIEIYQVLPVSIYIKDTNRPQLEEFDLNLNRSEITLRFNETVNTQSLSVTAITVQHANDSDGPLFSISLTNTSFSKSPNSTYLVISISTLDLNDIKRLTNVATSENSTYLSLTLDAIDDMEGNPIIQIPETSGLQVSNFTQDFTRPTLMQFSLDVDSGVLLLTFSETVNASSLNISQLTLQSGETSTTSLMYTLNEGFYPKYSYSNSTDDPIMTVYIGTSDLNAIKEIYQLATSRNNTYISFPNQTIFDMVDLPIEPVLEDFAQPVSSYQEDVTGPVLLSYTLNLTSEELLLTFDETINIESFNITQITLQSTQNFTFSSYKMLTGYRSLSLTNSTFIDILLALDDLDEIKLDTNLSTSPETTWLQVQSTALHDMALDPNPVQEIILAVDETNFVEDEVSPSLVSFSVDMNQGLLYLTFDEPVNVSSIDYTSISLYSGRVQSNAELNMSINSTMFNETDTNVTVSNITMEIDMGIDDFIVELPVTNYTLTGGETYSTNGRLVVVNITIDDLNEIKRDEYLFTSNLTSYITIESTAIEDMNRNPVMSIEPSNAKLVSKYFDDTTPPVFLGFDLDMNTGLIVLSFPETVDVSTVLFHGLILQRGPNVSQEIERYMLMGGNLTMMEDGVTAHINLTHDDLNEIKRRKIAVSQATAWLTVNESAILDMADQGVIMDTRMASSYIPDSTDPQLHTFDLDLDTEILTLSFTETVDVTRFNITSITLQDTASGNYSLNHYTLTESSSLNTSTYHTLEIVLGLNDLNTIKVLTDLATDENNTFISVESDLVEDVFGNNVESIVVTMALPVTTYIADNTSVRLSVFDLDMDLRVLTLYFSESVNASSLNVSEITLVGGQNPADQFFHLEESYTNSTDGPIIFIFFPRYDFNMIKILTNLATDENDTFVEITQNAVSDMAGNQLVATNQPDAQPVRNYTADISPPMLEYFDLDMNGVNITLYFSETVNVSSIQFSAITLVESSQPFAINYTLMDGDILSTNGPIVTLQLSKMDEDNLKRITQVGTNENNTLLRITSELVVDMDDNAVENQTSPIPLPVQYFTADIVPPSLINFTLDLNSNILTLTFSETVNATSLNIASISLQNAAVLDNTTEYHVLTDSNTLDADFNHPILQVNLSRYDGNEIRRLRMLATEQSNTYLVLEAGAVLDMVGIPSLAVINSTATMVANYTSDVTNPMLERFTLNLTSEVLTLSFSETVDIASFDATEVTLHGGQLSNSTSFTFTGGIVINRGDTPDVRLVLTTSDLNVIKLDTLLSTQQENTYLTLSNATVVDVNGNPVQPLPTPEVSFDFYPDEVAPELSHFDLDMNVGVLTLSFSESVNASSLDVTQIALQPATNLSSPSFIFSSSSFTSSDSGTVLIVSISLFDLNEIKRETELAINNVTTSISITEDAVKDMNENPILAIPSTSGHTVSEFIADITSPRLLSFTLDLDRENVTLYFSETVNATSVNVTGLSILNQQSIDATRVTLTEASVSPENDPVLILTFSQDDLNLLKSLTDLATDVNNTYISLDSYFLMDMVGNPIESVAETFAVYVDEVYPDMTPPQLRNYTLDLDSGEITLTFSESVNATSLQVPQLTLQSNVTLDSTGYNYTLRYYPDVPLRAEESSTIIVLTLTVDDLNEVKALIALVTSLNDTYISFTSQFLMDQFDNEIIAVSVGDARQAELHIPDTTCPYLQQFNFDLNEGLLNLTFNEPVNTSTFDPTQINIQNENSRNPLNNYLLSDGYYNNSSYTQYISLQLTEYDLNLIKANTELATSTFNTYVTLSPSSVQDTNGVYYCDDTLPIRATDVVPDSTQPVLVYYTLNMEEGELTLTFSEVVALPLDLTAITFLAEPDLTYMVLTMSSGDIGSMSSSEDFSSSGSGSSGSSSGLTSGSGSGSGSGMNASDSGIIEPMIVSLSLTGGDSVIDYSTTPHIVTVSITPYDLNQIKYRPDIAASAQTTLLAVTPSLGTDHNLNQVIEIPRSNPQELNSSNYFPDVTRPMLLSYQLDMDSLLLTLSFTEVINITSFDVRALTIQEYTFLIAGQWYTLQTSSARINPLNLPEVLVDLSASNAVDANAIKKLTSLATSSGDTHLSFPSTLLVDTFDLPVVPIANITALPIFPEDYTVDASSPLLLSFSVNLTTEILMLTFDETVDRQSTLPNRITFQSDISGSNPVHLTGGEVLNTEDSTVISILLDDYDLHSIKRDLDLATQLNNTCLEIDTAAIHDLSVLMNTNDITSLCATEYGEDRVSPQLTDFEVNLFSDGLLTLVFDEPVNISTINLTLVRLQSAESFVPGVESLSLSGGTANTTNQLQVIVYMTTSDTNMVKQMLSLLRGVASSFISIPSEFIADVNGNPVTEINTTDALMATGFLNDATDPMLLAFDIDMNTGILTLFFSETVDISTFNFTGITLQRDSSVTQPIHSLSLTSGTVSLDDDAPTVRLLLSNDDLNDIKTRQIARTESSVWLTLQNFTVMDILRQLSVIPIVNGLARPVRLYTPDTTPPRLVSFNLDLMAETLTLYFNESVDRTSLNTTEITLSPGPDYNESFVYTLTDTSGSVSDNVPEIVIQLGISDLNTIKQNTLLATSLNNTYIYFTSLTIADTFGNQVVERNTSDATRVSQYIPDTISPELVSFDLDMNTGILTLHFDETVNSSSLDTSGITFYGDHNGMGEMYTLSGLYDVVTPPDATVHVVLTNDDLNEIKVLEMLGTDGRNDTFLQIEPHSIRDMQGNPVALSDIEPVTRYRVDETIPELNSFEIDMNRGQLTLNFTESVNVSTLQFDHIALLRYETFVPTPSNPDDQYQLTGGEVITSNGLSVTFEFTLDDLNEIKRQDMCTKEGQEESCFLVYRSNAIADMNNNFIFGCRQSFEST